MSAYTPPDLLRRWQQEDLTADQVIGQLPQQHTVQTFKQRLRALEQQPRVRATPPRCCPTTIVGKAAQVTLWPHRRVAPYLRNGTTRGRPFGLPFAIG